MDSAVRQSLNFFEIRFETTLTHNRGYLSLDAGLGDAVALAFGDVADHERMTTEHQIERRLNALLASLTAAVAASVLAGEG